MNNLKLPKKIQNHMYADDLVSGGTIVDEVENLKQKSIEFFSKGGFDFHKRHSNILSLESTSNSSKAPYAKQMFSSSSSDTKILGLGWKKTSDKVNIKIVNFSEKMFTKRNVLSYIASIYDHLVLISSSHMIGKLINRDLRDQIFLGTKKFRIYLKLDLRNGWKT